MPSGGGCERWPVQATCSTVVPRPAEEDEMHLRALFVAAGELETLSVEEVRRRVDEDAASWVDLPGPDDVAAALETIKIQLEGGAPQSRFPAIWNLGIALIDDEIQGWPAWGTGEVVREIDTILGDFECLPVGLATTVVLGDEGFPDIYFRESPNLADLGIYNPPTLLSRFGRTLRGVRSACVRAQKAGQDVILVRDGGPLLYMWGSRPPAAEA
jgi:hypothetical protein